MTATGISKPWSIIVGDCLQSLRDLPDCSVHCCVTSPPYWGLRDYGHEGQLGLEATPELYVANMVEVFREVRRVLRDDGTLWLNLGDSYAAHPGQRKETDEAGPKQRSNRGSTKTPSRSGRDCDPKRGRAAHGQPLRFASASSLKPKDLVGIPWMTAFGLRADGWYLRQEIIWHKPNPMPESVLDRCTKAHEQIFLLTKSPRYFYDAEAIKEASTSDHPAGNKRHKGAAAYSAGDEKHRTKANLVALAGVEWSTRNKRSVWTVTTKPFKGAHFATFPPDLIEPCIKAGTSERGCCPDCGSPWTRIIERERVATRPGADTKTEGTEAAEHGNRDPQRHCTTTATTGWQAGCKCGREPIPCLVLDPFNGAGTTGLVARRLGQRYLGFEINPEYAAMASERIRDDMPLMNGVSA